MWSLHNPFFLLQNGEFMAKKKKHYCQVAKITLKKKEKKIKKFKN
jgi:hypothetical protein